MRTPKLRAVAVVAGFAGVSLLVAGTASAMVAGQADMPIASAVQLQQEDPTSQTAPVPAQVSAAAPIEVGSGAIKCDADGNCASRITVEARATEPISETAPASVDRKPVETGPTATNKKGSGTTKAGGDSANKPEVHGEPRKDAGERDSDRGKFDERGLEIWDNGWDDSWRDGWSDRLREGFGKDWNRSQWNASDWGDEWNTRNR